MACVLCTAMRSGSVCCVNPTSWSTSSGTEETKRFFNKELFSMMKPSAVYISIGRGITQNEDDLACALRDGVIRGASVDVFEREPLPAESPLWDISDDKLLLTAHSADRTVYSVFFSLAFFCFWWNANEMPPRQLCCRFFFFFCIWLLYFINGSLYYLSSHLF
ncbi:hypothetical protein C3747_689g10 [Trypanosoma cruzi]|uniref:D-isomer specific 2-hydroxyacid dehydrogenase NAD-binding domain-containing protein n=1 Tax=Trypanosoma cruzi TaxID=5693 RepID=A0A2V2UNS3_TRYCR|nr:hypothetical protein C3747_689g10 [Trypanosoma cruzi]